MKKSALSFYLNLFIWLVLTEVGNAVLLQTKAGKISGTTSKTLLAGVEYISYRGIPFAEPPTGSSRFKAPAPHTGWEGVYRAETEKTECVQFNENIKRGQPYGVHGAEDCLYLDVFTPSIDDSRLPALVFLHNEYFKYSSNKTKDYAPDFFMEEGVVVVTVSHRLTMFGFLSFEDDVLPGNSGIRDVILALEWIRDNISLFGGDPDRITLLGAQGGAALVDLLLHSQRTAGLFSSVILQGGTSWQSAYLPGEGKSRALKLADEVNIKASTPEKLLNKLSDASVHDLLVEQMKAVPDNFLRNEQKAVVPFGPIVEHDHPDAIINDFPENQFNSIDVPIMIGFNSQEGLESAFQYVIDPTFLGYLDRDFPLILPIRTGFRFEPYRSEFFDALEEVRKFYFRNGRANLPEYVTYVGDVLTGYPVDYSIRRYVNVSSEPIYYFIFDYSGSLNENKNSMLKWAKKGDDRWGAASADELCYLFMCPDLKRTYINLTGAGAEEISVLRRMVRLWANFAKYRNPTPMDDVILKGLSWKPATVKQMSYLHITENLEMKINPYAERYHFWDVFIEKYSKLSNKGVVGKIKDEL